MSFFHAFDQLELTPSIQTEFDIVHDFFTDKTVCTSTPQTHGVCVEIDETGYYDIIDLFDQMIAKLRTDVQTPQDSSKEIDKLEWIINNTTDAREKREAKDRLFEIKQEKKHVDQLVSYKERAAEIIQDYRTACESFKHFYFADLLIEIDSKKQLAQVDALKTFLSLCQEFVSIETSGYPEVGWTCCDAPKIMSENGSSYCENCTTTLVTMDSSGFNEQKRIATSKSKYYNIKHFVSAIKKCQGIHKKTIDPMIDKLQDEYLHHHNIKLEDYTIFNLMELLLRNSSLSKYYKDIHLIYRQKTGKQVNNLCNIEAELPQWYREQDKYADTIKLKADSKNSINAYYMVCRLAQLKGGRIDLEIKNFFCARDENTLAEYDACFEERCYKLGWLKPGERIRDYCR